MRIQYFEAQQRKIVELTAKIDEMRDEIGLLKKREGQEAKEVAARYVSEVLRLSTELSRTRHELGEATRLADKLRQRAEEKEKAAAVKRPPIT